MPENHIISNFDWDLKKLDNIIAEMRGLVEVKLASVITALLKCDANRASQVIALDKQLDSLQGDVDELALKMLALGQR